MPASMVLLALAVVAGLLAAPPATVVYVDSTGVVSVYMLVRVDAGLNTVRLPVEPILATLDVTINGTPTTPVYENGSLYILSEGPGIANISYVGVVGESNGILYFDVAAGVRATLVFDPHVILLTLPENVLDTRIVDGHLVVVVEGPERIEYIIRPPSTPQPNATIPSTAPPSTTPSETPAEAETPATASTTPATAPQQPESMASEKETGNQLLPIVALAVAVAAITVSTIALLAARRRSGGGVETSEVLDETDKAILDLLARSGGSMLQSEIQKTLGLPKTTAWRRIRRLEKMGYVEVVKEPSGLNRVVLKKKP